jgi:hypothetical protein
MKFFERTAKYALLYYSRNEGILEDLKVEPVNVKLRGYKSHWLRHVTRVNNRMQKVTMNYRPNGRRQLGKPVDEAESVSLRNNS